MLKTVSLVTLTAQNAILSLSMRHARTRAPKEELFLSSTGEINYQLTFFCIFSLPLHLLGG